MGIFNNYSRAHFGVNHVLNLMQLNVKLSELCYSFSSRVKLCLQLVGEYMLYRDGQPSAEALHTVSCRLLLDIMPGLETSVIFQDNVRDSLSRNISSYL